MADADIDRLAFGLEPHRAAQASAFSGHDIHLLTLQIALWLLGLLFATAGIYLAVEESLEPAMTADLVPDESVRGTAYGVLATVNGFLMLDLIYVLTMGGPGHDTTTVSWLGFQTAFTFFKFGPGTAILYTLTALCLLLTMTATALAAGVGVSDGAGVLDANQVKNAAPNIRYRMILLLLYSTGLRRAEASRPS